VAASPTRRDTALTDDLQLHGPTITVFGDRDALDAALSDELSRRGRSTHTVTTPLGWLASVTHAVVRLDTAPGERALQDLALRDVPATHVVAVCETPLDDATSARFDELCRQCGDHHEVSVIWHGPLEVHADALTQATPRAVLEAGELASTIADEIGHQETHGSRPSFASQVFAPQAHDTRS
jgi:hypothetical protein